MEKQFRMPRRARRRSRGRLTLLVIGTAAAIAALPGCTAVAPSPSARATATPTATATPAGAHRASSLEAGVEAWPLPSAVSREAVVPNGSGLTVLGGLDASGGSVATVSTIDPASGAITASGALRSVVHDAGAATLGTKTFDFGGGTSATVATVESVPSPQLSQAASAAGDVAGTLPQPRSDLAVATVTDHGRPEKRVAYIVGGYDGSAYIPAVLATSDGTHFTTVAHLPVPVRYPAVATLNGKIYAFGGQTKASGSAVTATDDIQVIDPSSHTASVVGHLPQPLYGAAAFTIDGTLYVAGGQVPGGPTQTQIYAVNAQDSGVLKAGLLPQAEAFGGYATTGSGGKSVGYIVGGEVAGQSGSNQAGQASGSLSTVMSLRVSPYGGAAGPASAGAPFAGSLLIADRGNNRLVVIDAARNLTWQYPSATMPAPPGGFYFPDDSFFFSHGTGIISNQEDNHTIVEIGYPSGKILWQYGHPMQPGSAPGFLDQPDDAYLLKSGVITVADASNNRILFISPQKTVLGQIGDGRNAHVPGTSVAYPNGDTPLANGDVLVSEINGSWISEYSQSGKLAWSTQFPSVAYPSDPQQLGPDRYLMTDYNPGGDGRILEFNREGQILWKYDATAGEGLLRRPSLAERLPSGMIMVNDDYSNRIVVIDPKTNSIVWQYGLTGVQGTAPGLLSIPDGFDNLLADGSTPTHPDTK